MSGAGGETRVVGGLKKHSSRRRAALGGESTKWTSIKKRRQNPQDLDALSLASTLIIIIIFAIRPPDQEALNDHGKGKAKTKSIR